jgi:hypothetical protein
LLSKLLAGDEGVESLLAENPFPDEIPEHVRAVRYRLPVTSPQERAETDDWWRRGRVGTYAPPVSEKERGGEVGRIGSGLR